MKRMKRISIGILFLLSIGIFASFYEAGGYSPRSSATWVEKSLPFGEPATDIAIGLNGEVFCIGKLSGYHGGFIYRWDENNKRWDDSIQGKLRRITVDNKGCLIGYNDAGMIYKLENGWKRLSNVGLPPGCLIDIAIGGQPGNEKLWAIGPSQGTGKGGHAYYYLKSTNSWKKVDKDWEGKEVFFTRITVSGHGFPFAMNGFTGKVYQGDSSSWSLLPGIAYFDIAAGIKDTYLLGYYINWRYGSFVYKFVNFDHWEAVKPYGLATNIAVSGSGGPWIVNAQGRIYRYV